MKVSLFLSTAAVPMKLHVPMNTKPLLIDESVDEVSLQL